MFFRNQKAKVENFEERIAGLKELRFTATMESAGRCRVTLRFSGRESAATPSSRGPGPSGAARGDQRQPVTEDPRRWTGEGGIPPGRRGGGARQGRGGRAPTLAGREKGTDAHGV